MKNLKISLLIVTFLMLSTMLSSLAMAQNIPDLEIVAGETSTNVLVETTTVPSDNLGGATVSLEEIYTEYINFAGLNLWESSDTLSVQSFTTYLIEANTIPDFSNLTNEGLFQTTNLISIAGNPDFAYETYNMSFSIADTIGADTQNLGVSHIFQDVPFNSEQLIVQFEQTTDLVYRFNDEALVTEITGTLCDSSCPTPQEIETEYGFLPSQNDMYFTYLLENGDSRMLVYFVDSILSNSQYIIDMNLDNVFDFDIVGNLKQSQSDGLGQSCLIAESGVYDLWIEQI